MLSAFRKNIKFTYKTIKFHSRHNKLCVFSRQLAKKGTFALIRSSHQPQTSTNNFGRWSVALGPCAVIQTVIQNWALAEKY